MLLQLLVAGQKQAVNQLACLVDGFRPSASRLLPENGLLSAENGLLSMENDLRRPENG